ncbi:MAG: hypothetical protein ACRD30_04715, partial [Bryobacteraceae bacterium]
MTPVMRNRGERGFAMLIVFMLAAAIALLLYRQMPRAVFESQRQKEQTLIDHGDQYKRAIQLYFIAFKKYPSKIEDLENTNNQRFLRRRYIDPMTGKNEWRLIHVNGAGQLTDSLVQKPPAPLSNNGNNTQANNTQATGTATGATGAPGTDPPQVNATVYRRPSDRSLTSPGTGDNPPSDDPNDPRNWPPIALVPVTGASGATGAQPNQARPGSPNGAQGGLPQPIIPGLPGQAPIPNIPGQNNNGTAPTATAPGQDPLTAINNLLTHTS